ncbi:pyridoxal-phosphate-dependent aminotransferase family protein [Catenulispora pinisilvae]|uniref:pyridoxal-phosphate-dependent aminotransferase family protein n=1 Tax=Catenulispora pinisilvae TaxID=2705253 RepID=UPI001E426E5D|nr:alanine--glyoxylate aminotransferase family protein [Catenulispora pinisilvae]
MVDERTPGFALTFAHVVDGLRQVLGTASDVLVFTSSTTGAFEGAVQNLFSPGDKVLVVNNGAFGERWVQMCRAFGLEVVELAVGWGRSADAADVTARLVADPAIVAVIVVHCETSTGVVTDLRELGRAAANVLTIVDSASGVGGCELRADEWGLDVVIGGSQKALMAPPGISFASVSERAWRRHTTARMPRYYFDWTTTRDALRQPVPRTPWTPAIGTLLQLAAALDLLLDEGMAARVRRHVLLGRMARAGLQGMGLSLLTPESDRNAIVTAAYCPADVSAGHVVQAVADNTGVQLTAGNGDLTDQVIRLGHCGHMDPLDIVAALAAIEAVLPAFGVAAASGSGVVPALEVLRSDLRPIVDLQEGATLAVAQEVSA